ncbi:hypothetical protein D9611_004226 [Ephemerocybe angulata]|uniref:F-box domain-containing protein n=1 Tax=Ephemerocybe angulata TaxID=980116 RepID=A0A8H5BK36_9AGAR|nr:hypothetical protein D9611_004226 [Tulosesus angulatus]
MSPSSSLPVHEKLPTELMLHIFAFAIALPYSYDEVTLIFHGRHSPLYLGRICRAWRSIAWTTPSLWSAIDMKIPTDHLFPNGGINADEVDLFEQWLQRAQDTPLSLRFRKLQGPVPTNQTYGLLVSKILSRSKQWVYLDYLFPRSNQNTPFAEVAMHGGLPLLQTLIVGGEVVPKEWLHSAPNLSTLIISNRNWDRRVPEVECALPNGSRLQYLKVHSIQPELFLDILRASSSHLVSCDVTFYDQRLTQVGPPAISLPRLVKFVISQSKTARMDELLGLIHCPALSDLTLSNLRRIQRIPSTRLDIRGLFGRWGRNLTSLTLSSGKLEECEDIIPALEVLSSLRHLTLAYVYHEDKDREDWKEWKRLSKLLYTSTTFLPALDTLRLVYGFKEDDPPAVSAYVATIESFRTVDNFPLRDPLVPFKVILYDN